MIHALKSLKPHTTPHNLVPSRLHTHLRRQSPTFLRFSSYQSEINMDSQQQDNNQQEKAHCPPDKNEDVMSHSFGDGYKTRSDEEGFGGVYGGNQSEEDDEIGAVDVNHVLHPEYDKSQGSEVKEKEKARNQMEASS